MTHPTTWTDHPDDRDPDDPVQVTAPTRTGPRRPEASGSGRVVPEAKAPMRDSGASKRSQPTRQPRSKRGK